MILSLWVKSDRVFKFMKTKLCLWFFVVLGLWVGVEKILAQPVLNIGAVGNQSVLFWPVSATNYVLQSSTNLDSTN